MASLRSFWEERMLEIGVSRDREWVWGMKGGRGKRGDGHFVEFVDGLAEYFLDVADAFSRKIR